MEKDMAKLLEAQKIDLEIDKINKYRTEYPHQQQQLKQEVERLHQELEKTATTITENETSRRNIESEISAEREQLLLKEQRLLETKTNKEYNAVQNEITQARERIDSLETEDLELMTSLDSLIPQKAELEKTLTETEKKNHDEIKDIQKKFESIESDITALEHKRKLTLEGVNARALSIYSRLRRGKDGVAVSVVDPVKFSCRGCFKQLPPQKVLELRRKNKMIFCENCGRILVWDSSNE